MVLKRKIFLILALSAIVISTIAISGCETLKSTKPIGTVMEYERMLLGRLDADYVGTDNCLSACHFHDKKKQDFEASTMGAQLSAAEGMPLVNCESCHGPGSLAIKGLTPKKVKEDAKIDLQTECDYLTFIDLKELPAAAMSLMCLKCHTANATFNLHDWNVGDHASSEVSCSDCHKIHVGPDLIISPEETADMCLKCHQKARAEFSLPSRHPVLEKKVFCTDCHDPHGTITDNLFREDTAKESCTRCHAEKEGPFIYEHADLIEDCISCHTPHGSANNNLLKARLPFLCLQCHPGHSTTTAKFYTRCTDCHSQIHGTDLGKGKFIK